MAAAREDLKELMKDIVSETIDKVVDKTFAGFTSSINKIEARQSQHARQILQVQHEVSSQRAKIGVRAPPAQASSSSSGQAAASGPGVQDISTPRNGTDADGQTIQIIWPRRMTRERFQGVHNNVMAEYLTDEDAVALVQHFKNGNRELRRRVPKLFPYGPHI